MTWTCPTCQSDTAQIQRADGSSSCGWCGYGSDVPIASPPVTPPVAQRRRPARRRSRNWQHREDWRARQGGELCCAICTAAESTVRQIEVHHITPLADGGQDELWNTIPLCDPCHRVAHALRAHYRHAVGQDEWPGAA